MLITIEPVTTTCKYCKNEFTYTPVRQRAVLVRKSYRKITQRSVCDDCRHDPGRISRIKAHGPSRANETKQQRDNRLIDEHRRDYILGISVVQPGPHTNEWEQGWPMADNECEHGRLKGDQTPPCGCWDE